MNDNLNKEVKKLRPFTRFIYTIGELPSSYLFSMTYEEQLIWLCNYLAKTVIPTVNNNGEAVEELQTLYIELKEYVDNYFENLDVQEEINNKLDEMAESGQLTDIIAQYLTLAGVLAFNTIDDLSNALNIVEGSICYALGHLSYNDGKGGFYKIRTITSGDVVDGFNIVALDVSNTLIAERMPDYYINEINNTISTMNNTLEDVIDDVESLNNIVSKHKDNKFVCVDNPYDPRLDLIGEYNGLSFEIFKQKNAGTTLSVQGNAVYKKKGMIYSVNNLEIFALTDTNLVNKHTLFSSDFGHAGDCCIYQDKMYISDSDNDNLYAVDLNNGDKTTFHLNTYHLINDVHPEYTPKFAGVCMDETDDYCYICYCDEENSDHTVKTGATVRFYKYDFDSTYEKLFEIPQDLCYLQGATLDNDYFYFIGNKPFTTSYAGQKLYIISKKDYSILDVLENDSSYEVEGLDYCSYRGCEGLLTACCYGSSGDNYFGMYAFNGNSSETIHFKDSGSQQAFSTRSRSGVVTTQIHITGNFQPDQSFEYANFFDYNFPIKDKSYNDFIYAVSYEGSNRNVTGHAQWELSTNKLIIRTGTNSTASDKLDLTFWYLSE